MQNDNKANESLKTISGQSDNKHTFFILAVAGLLIGILLAIFFVPQDQGTELKTEHALLTGMEGQPTESKLAPAKVAANKTEALVSKEIIELENAQEDPIEDVKRAFGDREALNVLSPPTYHPRPKSEWQGMLIDTSMQSVCEGKNSCGLAMACKNNLCGPCSVNADCAAGEACVLDHCVIEKNASCRTASECGANEQCVLSGYSTDPRGNGTTLAFCQPMTSGSQPTPELNNDPVANDPGPPVFERPVSINQLQETLLEHDSSTETDADPDADQPPPVNSEQFDEDTAEFEFEQHENFDKIDPENEHVVVPEQAEEADANPDLDE